MPARCRSASASSSASAGTMSNAVSTGSPMASADVAAAMPWKLPPRRLTG